MKKLFNIIRTALQKEHDRFALCLPVLLGVGIGIYFLLPYEPDIFSTSLLCSALFLGCVIFWKNYFFRIVFIAFLIISIGILRSEIRTQSVAAPILKEEIFYRLVHGTISDIQIKEKGEKLILSSVVIEGISEEETPKFVSISLKQVEDGLNVGDRIEIKATLFPPPTPVMPKAYDFARMFYYDQLGAVGYSAKSPVILEKAPPNNFAQKLNSLRLSLTERIVAPMDSENGWIAAAMMVGEMSGVPKETADAMRESGIYHVLSISGLHMSLATMLVFFTVRFLLCLYPPLALHIPVKKISAFIAFLGAFAYLLLAGYPVPALRSFIMVACVMLAILFDRSGISIFSLAWAAMITLLWQPEALLGASFQLSFAATIAILAFYEKFSTTLYKPDKSFVGRIWLYFLGIMLTSLVATAATAPFVIYNFNRFTLWGVVSNMLLAPLVSAWIMPAIIIAFVAMPFDLEYYPLKILDSGISFMVSGARFFASLPYATISLPSPSFIGIILVIAGGLWLCIWLTRLRLLGIPLIIIGMATIAMHKPYDLLISSDASKVMLRLTDGNFIFLRGKEDSFDGQVWLRANGKEHAITAKELPAEFGSCTKSKCNISIYGKNIVVNHGKKEISSSCDDNPDIVISANYLRDIPQCQNIKFLFDKEFLDQSGATALYFDNEKTIIETSREYRGNRGWVIGE